MCLSRAKCKCTQHPVQTNINILGFGLWQLQKYYSSVIGATNSHKNERDSSSNTVCTHLHSPACAARLNTMKPPGAAITSYSQLPVGRSFFSALVPPRYHQSCRIHKSNRGVDNKSFGLAVP